MKNRVRKVSAGATLLAALSVPFGVAAFAATGDPGNSTGPIGTGSTLATTISVADASSIEGECGAFFCNQGAMRFVRFTVTRTGSNLPPATVRYATMSGTAVAGSDFFPAPLGASVSFAAGQKTGTIAIRTIGDSVDDVVDVKSFTLKLTSATQPIADGVATGTIEDDDTPN